MTTANAGSTAVHEKSHIDSPSCQIKCLEQMSQPLRTAEIVWQIRHRLKRIVKRRLRYLWRWLSEIAGARAVAADPVAGTMAPTLLAGDLVRVKSRQEIRGTLDGWNYLKGCSFMEEMWQYCGTTQRVLKAVEQFLDERDYRVKRTRGIVLLEELTCEGTVDYGRCDRTCYYFWRQEWLEKE